MTVNSNDVSRGLIRRVGDVRVLLRERLWLQVLIATALGIGTGLLLTPSSGWVSPGAGAIITS